MSYMVIFQFQSQQNQQNFINKYTQYQPNPVSITEGYIPTSSGPTGQSVGPSSGIGAPSGPPSSGTTFVELQIPSLSLLDVRGTLQSTDLGPPLQGLAGYNPIYIMDNNNPSNIQYDPNLIDPNSLTVIEPPNNIIIFQGQPGLNYTPDTPPPPGPIDFQPIYPDPTKFVVPPGTDPTTAPDVPYVVDPLDRPESIWSDPLPHQSPSDLLLPSPQGDPYVDYPEIKLYPSDRPDWLNQPLSLDKDIIINPPATPDSSEFTKQPEDRTPQSQQISFPGTGEGGGSPALQQSYWIVIGPSFSNTVGGATSFGTGNAISTPANTAVASSQISSFTLNWTTVEIVSDGQSPPGPIVFSGGSNTGSQPTSGAWAGSQVFNSFNTGGHIYQSMPPLASSGSNTTDFQWTGSIPLPGTGTVASNDSTNVAFIPAVPGGDINNSGWFASPLVANFNYFGDTITSAALYNSVTGPGQNLFATTNGPDTTANPGLTNFSPNKVGFVGYDASTITATSTGGGITIIYKTVAAGRRQDTGSVVFLMQGGTNVINI